MHFLCKFFHYIMFLTILPRNNYLNGAKLSQNIFHFHSTAIFFKIDYFTKLLHISVVRQLYDANSKNDSLLLKIKEMA